MSQKKGNPGCPCCDCDCTIAVDYGGWTETAGSWAYSSSAGTYVDAATSDSNAELTCHESYAEWSIAEVAVLQQTTGEWIRIGFRDTSGDDRVYLRWKIEKPASVYVHHLEIVEVNDGGSPTTLASTTWNGTSSIGERAKTFHVWHDPDNGLFEVFYPVTSNWPDFTGSVRVTISVNVDRLYVATETIANTITFRYGTWRNFNEVWRKCFERAPNSISTYVHTNKAPSEWEITISGVIPYAPKPNPDYDEFNDTFAIGYNVGRAIILTGTSSILVYSDMFQLPHFVDVYFHFSCGYWYPPGHPTPLRAELMIGSFLYGNFFKAKNWRDGTCRHDWRAVEDECDYYYDGSSGLLLTPAYEFYDAIGVDFSNAIICAVPVP